MSKHHFIPAHERARLSRLEAELIEKHDAAVEAAIDIEQLPKGTAILIPPSHRYERDILVQRPSDANYVLFARVWGEEVAFAEDDVTAKAEARLGG